MTQNIEEKLKEFVEKGASLEHDRWARWQKYLHSLCTSAIEHETDMPHCWCNPKKEVQSNGSIVIVHDKFTPLVIPLKRVKHWERQIATPYAELSEKEKEYDREEVRKYLPLIQELITQTHNNALQEAEGAIVSKNLLEKLQKEILKQYWQTQKAPSIFITEITEIVVLEIIKAIKDKQL